MSAYQPLKRPVLTLPFLALSVIALIGTYYLALRFIHGMGIVTNLNGGYAWGVWVVYDVVVGTALACGGYALAITVYVMNKGKYHPLMRTALLASLLGYGLGGVGAMIDMGRYWQFYNIFTPWHMNFNSVMLEVGLCVATYILVLCIEFAPTLLEKIGAKGLIKSLNKVLFIFIALGVLLPTMHQSSLGSMLIAMGWKVHPLWQSLHLQPLLAILTALTMGFAVVVFEASFSSVGFRRRSETPLLAGLGKGIVGLIAVYLLFRFGELLVNGKLGLIFAGDLGSLMFLLETALFVFPLVVLSSAKYREHGPLLLWASVSMLFAGSLYRFNAFLITYDPGAGYSYFPSVPEIMVTAGMVALEIMVFLFVVKKFPVLHDAKHA
ncbi:MAG: Ni/Fe-hydrogenase cytochrome b subunit [gamma proteobacterium symbiont of Ctena orbiculata]|uniref:Ni/Fe-hydrogenase cytochrome b subunit n=1 Tax=Candidatus Thiodiazotropha taylori TaxID=2792791 RepID=A0A944MEY9_9GAMM|nr:Ni/Fe-hydrogenase cytochrome b subunit [Candidatus Thiodiazotropha taylori]PUB88545.1 MAG: Ni/Fe-hydrogenase cytochrome b subunit [gamma proteobacterium symbiont of Ctena orbiculata]MBT2989775.1 Ni/Fe-hydrogenase cytochrome b subunit [Candidatus Thiodiazotropha taylori]MBT2995886.1 Ni/Fe-hydrogenase cytochrome b subunit [Candidatus Thiodiazotropha taylori]MBT2999201.1 Ni/Fe-hydrogenase cytochrome b subunit [Candidatus Thiodiazotropha taylori]